ncbi:Protein NAR1-like protein [Vigna angularis]|uniref:Protein NAR1-like protein n=1 Tax=Phaseolus angularis TaxID=3914 RepID=A0A8T0JZC9_PHAAN|nr:Protein NAR1-like protein [Vigna angularis]
MNDSLTFRHIKNSDFQEVTLEVEGKTVLKFAMCYGFRNLQNIVRKLETGKCDYHFLEIMACPSASPFDNPIIKGLYDKWLEQPGFVKARRYMHTQYHPVEKSITSQLHN